MQGPLIIDAAEREPIRYDREHVLLLTDWTFEEPMSVFRNLKTMEGYYNFQERTIADFSPMYAKGFLTNRRDARYVGPNAYELAGYRRCHRQHLYLPAQRPLPRKTGTRCSRPVSGYGYA